MSSFNYPPQGGGGSGGVSSWNSRTGVVVPASGDYTYDQITNAQRLFTAVVVRNASASVNVTNINAAVSAASVAGGGIVTLLVGEYNVNASIDFSGLNNVFLIGSGYGTVIKAELGGTWTNSSVIYCEGDIVGLAFAVNNVTKGDTTITCTTASNASPILAGGTVIIQGTDAQGIADAEWHQLSINGNGATGVLTLKDKVRRTMTSVVITDATLNSQNNTFSNFRIDGSAATDSAGLIGLQCSNSLRTKVSRVWIENFSYTNQEAMRVNAGIEHTIEDVYILKCDSYAILCAVAIGCNFRNVSIDTANVNGVLGGAIQFSFSAADCDFQDIKIYNGNYDAFRITATTSACRRIRVNGLDCSRVLGNGFYASGGGDHQLINATFTDVNESAVLLNNTTRFIGEYVANRVQFGIRTAGGATYNTIKAQIANVTNDAIYNDSSSYNDFSQCNASIY